MDSGRATSGLHSRRDRRNQYVCRTPHSERRLGARQARSGRRTPNRNHHRLGRVGRVRHEGEASCRLLPGRRLAWSADGSSLAYSCGPIPDPSGIAPETRIHVLRLRGSGHTTIPTGSDAVWPSWSPSGTRIAYSTQLKPTEQSAVYTVALDGSHKRLLASGGAAPAWSPDGRTIAYQTKCGIRLVTPSGRNVTPRARANACGAIGLSGPPVWSPDGTKLAVETKAGIYVMDKSGKALHRVSRRATTTWYGDLPGRPSWRTGP